MKTIMSTSHFRRHYQERIAPHEPLVNRFQAKLETLLHDPARVRVPLLMDKLVGHFAFEVAPDCRVVFRKQAEKLILVDIGTHAQVCQR